MSAAAPQRAAAPRRAPQRRPSEARPQPRRHLRVAPRHAGRRRARLALAIGVLVSVASLFLLVACHVLIAQGQFELARLADRQEVEQRRYERQRLEVAERSAPANIVAAAEQLGLVVPERIEYVVAPEAAPHDESGDRTATTLEGSWDEVKQSLAAQP